MGRVIVKLSSEYAYTQKQVRRMLRGYDTRARKVQRLCGAMRTDVGADARCAQTWARMRDARSEGLSKGSQGIARGAMGSKNLPAY